MGPTKTGVRALSCQRALKRAGLTKAGLS